MPKQIVGDGVQYQHELNFAGKLNRAKMQLAIAADDFAHWHIWMSEYELRQQLEFFIVQSFDFMIALNWAEQKDS